MKPRELTDSAYRAGDLFTMALQGIWPDLARGITQGILRSPANEDWPERTAMWAYHEESDALGITVFDRAVTEDEIPMFALGDEDHLYAIPDFKMTVMVALMAMATQVPPEQNFRDN